MSLALIAGHASASPRAGVFPDERIKVDKRERAYRLVVPDSLDLDKPAPLVLAFHGFAIDNKDVMPWYTKLPATAQKHKFILCFPNALDATWGIAPQRVRDDLAFFDALLARLRSQYRIDPHRVHLVGMSNGGYFAHTVARERSDAVASIASHSGALGLETLAGIHAKRKFPVMIVHGDADRLLPVAIARENRDKYLKEGHEVRYIEAPGLGHAWAEKQDINEQLWRFFQSHPLKPEPKKPGEREGDKPDAPREPQDKPGKKPRESTPPPPPSPKDPRR